MPSNLNPVRENLHKYIYVAFSLIFLIAGTLRWLFGFPDDRVIAICIFAFALFLSNRIGEKLRNEAKIANKMGRSGRKLHT